MRKQQSFRSLILVIAALLCTQLALAQAQQAVAHGYQKPPKPIPELLDAAPTPAVIPSPKSDYLLVADRMANPPIADLAQPMLRLAGIRINPITNGRHHPPRLNALHLIRVQDGKEQTIQLPQNAYLSAPEWSGDGQHFAFTNTTSNGIELWVGDVASASAHRILGIKVNPILLEAVQWMPDSKALLVKSVPQGRGNPPAEAQAPDGPIIQESDGKKSPAATYEDLLQSSHDEDLFDYYSASQLLLVEGGKTVQVGKPGLYTRVDTSPDGKHILSVRLHRPYSYLLPFNDFPKEVEVWDATGKLEFKLASLPLAEHVPIEGVMTGARDYQWIPSEPATLAWAEALDGGDTRAKVPYHDHLLTLSSPFKSQPVELAKTEYRFSGMTWGEKGMGLVRDFDRSRRWVRTFIVNASEPGHTPKLLFERSIRDRYRDPGNPVMRHLANGQRVIWQNGDSIFLVGQGASPKGEYPFLDRFNLQTLKSERLFHSADGTFEEVVALAADDASRVITRFESPENPPNYFLRTTGSNDKKVLTHFPDPQPQLRGITKQLVTYKRADGVPLSFTLYLPANYKQGERLPTIVWAYPLEFNDADTAGQVAGTTNRFTTISGISHLFLLTQGYAVLDNATMPVVGDPDTMNNTYVEQVVSSAKAAIDKAVEMGVTDPNRVGVGGHSYGAFMTANLLAHSDLFRAGVARSGAYNRTLTPFGFQSERRTLWEAPEMYLKISPFMYADKIRHPILLIHGMADDNSGTFPIQSERMYQAIKGNGGIVRYVQLPYEAHGYLGRESVEHTLYEMVSWFDKWVKNAPPANATSTAKAGDAK
ncbi:MAG: prolyl oligopeptidase [Candidatus Angelobacter sp. Gp1-AA117]|nr:MAG: prolyl oligopeptidase [Candidatus Angelobacter sp. Gp1-AA117]